MPSTLSTQRGSRPAEETAAIHGWSSLLPDDLVIQVGNCLLADNDIYSYLDFRAVCTSWRRPTDAKPPAGRFQPSKWALIGRRDDVLTFVNVETGRFVSKNVPLLRRYFFAGATGGGMIILEEPMPPYQVRVLNPFTGLIVRFKASLPSGEEVREATMTTSLPMTLFISGRHGSNIMWADQDSEHFHEFRAENRSIPVSMAPFRSNVYVSDREGSILSPTAAAAEEHNSHRSAQAMSMATIIPTHVAGHPASDCYVVKSGDELLLVTRPWYEIHGKPVVHRVDTERNELELVTSIGNNRALFLSDGRCLSVDADKFESIEGGCIYFIDPVSTAGNGVTSLVTTFRVAEQVQDDVELDQATMVGGSSQPSTLAQVFANYFMSIYKSERGANRLTVMKNSHMMMTPSLTE